MNEIYRTVSGDTWDLIGYKLFGPGGEKYYKELIRNNILFVDIVIFDSNIPIKVPKIEINNNNINSTKIPPWKR